VWHQKEKGKTTKSIGILSSKLFHTVVAQNHATFALSKKLQIIQARPGTLPNKSSELISKCRYRNKFLLKNVI